MRREKHSIQTKIFSFLILFTFTSNLSSDIEDNIALHKEQFSEVALKIWEYAELGYQETKSSNLLASELKKEGFKITGSRILLLSQNSCSLFCAPWPAKP